jgi:hypothetical protein
MPTARRINLTTFTTVRKDVRACFKTLILTVTLILTPTFLRMIFPAAIYVTPETLQLLEG